MQRINVFKYADPDVDGSETHLNGWFDLDKAVEIAELTRWDGNNRVSVHVPKFHHNALYRTAGRRWVLQSWSQWQGTMEHYEYIDDERAREWLTVNESDDIVERYFGGLGEERGPGRPAVGRPVQVRLGDLESAVDEYAEAINNSRSESVRQLVRFGLERYAETRGAEKRSGEPLDTTTPQQLPCAWEHELGLVPNGN